MDHDFNEQSRIIRVIKLLSPCWPTVAWALILTLISSGLNSVEPMVQRILIDALMGHTDIMAMSNMSIAQVIFSVVACSAVIAVVRGAFGGWSTYLTWKLRLRSNKELLDQAASRIYNQSLSYHRNARSGELMSNLNSGVNGFSSVINDIMQSLLPNMLFLACTFMFMLAMDIRLTLIALVFAPIPAFVSLFAGRIAALREKKIVKRWADIYARFAEGLSLAKTVKSFGLEKAEHKRFVDSVEGANSIVEKGAKLDWILGFIKNRITDAARLSVLCYGAFLVARGEISIGTLVAFLSFTGNLFGPILGVMSVYETMRKARVYLDTVYDIIDTPNSVQERANARALAQIEGTVEFDHVSFGYIPNQPVLKSISFKVKPASMIALVGGSGSGKTTVIDLVNRFYDPESGRVFIDGTDVRDIKVQSLRAHIGMVLQDTGLFNDTIRNNIACARPNASEQEIENAARAAAAESFIQRKPHRYETVVGEQGGQLSAGERQRIAIARAILKDPQIFIFDEASSNLDAESEELIGNVIGELAKTKTVFIVAHRLATIRDADQILVLDDGELREQGTHEELMALHGHYHRLVLAQADCAEICEPAK